MNSFQGTSPTQNMAGQNFGGQGVNNYQQQPISQPAWTNSYNAQPNYNQAPQNNSNVKFIILGVIIVVAIIAIALAFNLNFGNKNSNQPNTNSNNASSYKVKFKGFTFKIPSNLVYETQTNAVVISDEEGTWSTCLEVAEGSFEQVLSNKSKLQSVYQQQGYTASSAIEKAIGGVSFITIELSKSGENGLLGIAKANSMYVFGVTAFNLDNEFDYNLLKNVSSVLSSAEYTGDTANIKPFDNFDLSDISELAK
jgi:hypothetical protein